MTNITSTTRSEDPSSNIIRSLKYAEKQKITKLNQLANNELNNGLADLTFPTFNYCGPGTKVINNLLNNVKPTGNLDNICMFHDLGYLQDKQNADNIMVGQLLKQYGLIPAGLASAAFNIWNDETEHIDDTSYDLLSKIAVNLTA